MKKVLLKIMKEVRERIELDQDKNICSAFDSVIIKNNVLGDWRVLELHINNSGNFYNKVTELNHKKQKAFPEFYKFIKEIGEKLHNENFHIKNTSYHISDPWKTDKAGRLYYLDKFIEYLNRQIIEQEDNEKIIVPEMINKKSFIKFEQEVKLSVWKTNLFKEIYSGIKSHKETFICTALQNLLLQDKFYLELLSKSYLDEDKFFIYFKNYYLLDFMHFIQTVGQKYVDRNQALFYSGKAKKYSLNHYWLCSHKERLKELEKFISITAHK